MSLFHSFFELVVSEKTNDALNLLKRFNNDADLSTSVTLLTRLSTLESAYSSLQFLRSRPFRKNLIDPYTHLESESDAEFSRLQHLMDKKDVDLSPDINFPYHLDFYNVLSSLRIFCKLRYSLVKIYTTMYEYQANIPYFSLLDNVNALENADGVFNVTFGKLADTINLEITTLKHIISNEIATSKFAFQDASINLVLAQKALKDWKLELKTSTKKAIVSFFSRFIHSISKKTGIYFYNIINEHKLKIPSSNVILKSQLDSSTSNTISLMHDFCIQSNATNVALFYLISEGQPFFPAGYSCVGKEFYIKPTGLSSFPVICGYPQPLPPADHLPNIISVLQDRNYLIDPASQSLAVEIQKSGRRSRNFSLEGTFYANLLRGAAKERNVSILGSSSSSVSHFYDRVLLTTYFYARVDPRIVCVVTYKSKNVPSSDFVTLDFMDQVAITLNHLNLWSKSHLSV